MRALVESLLASPGYAVAMAFLAIYPIVTAIYWSMSGLVFTQHRERDGTRSFYDIDDHPFVSVVVPAHDEEAVIEDTVRHLLALDWPRFEVVIVDDASDDGTVDILESFARQGLIRLVRKEQNEGKAMALNDVLPLLRGEIVLIVDADGHPAPDALRWMVPHFVRVPRVAAVTGNPRVANTSTLLAKLQAIEFSATVSVLRRAQATWGRLLTFSGICTALRKSAMEEVGRFQPDMATEDIALSWQLQARFFDVRYEPRALFAMQVPETLSIWWRQRTRWARGLAQVLRRHSSIFTDVRCRRMWPVWIEAACSTLWSILFAAAVLVWSLAYGVGAYDFGANPVPNFWGMLIAAIGIVQIVFGLWWDGRYDSAIRRYVLWAPLYPLFYWMLTAAATVWAAPGGLLRKPHGTVTWRIPRKTVHEQQLAPSEA